MTHIAKRTTFDGHRLYLHADGAITGPLGAKVPGAWFRPTEAQRERALDAGWLAFGEVEVTDLADIPCLLRAARHVVDQCDDKSPGKLRQVFSDRRARAAFTPAWTTISANAQGEVTERVWRLPRLGKWSGIAVFDSMNGPSRLSVHHRIAGSRDTFDPSGITFPNQLSLFRWLLDNPTTPAC